MLLYYLHDIINLISSRNHNNCIKNFRDILRPCRRLHLKSRFHEPPANLKRFLSRLLKTKAVILSQALFTCRSNHTKCLLCSKQGRCSFIHLCSCFLSVCAEGQSYNIYSTSTTALSRSYATCLDVSSSNSPVLWIFSK